MVDPLSGTTLAPVYVCVLVSDVVNWDAHTVLNLCNCKVWGTHLLICHIPSWLNVLADSLSRFKPGMVDPLSGTTLAPVYVCVLVSDVVNWDAHTVLNLCKVWGTHLLVCHIPDKQTADSLSRFKPLSTEWHLSRHQRRGGGSFISPSGVSRRGVCIYTGSNVSSGIRQDSGLVMSGSAFNPRACL